MPPPEVVIFQGTSAHLLCGRWKWCVWVTACGQYPGRSSCATSRSRQPGGNLRAQDAVLVIKIKHHSNVVTSPLLHQRGKYDQHLRPPGETEAQDHPDLSDLGMTGAPDLGAAPSSAGPDRAARGRTLHTRWSLKSDMAVARASIWRKARHDRRANIGRHRPVNISPQVTSRSAAAVIE